MSSRVDKKMFWKITGMHHVGHLLSRSCLRERVRYRQVTTPTFALQTLLHTSQHTIAGYAAVSAGLTLVAPSEAWAEKSSIERLVESGYANLTAEKSVTVQSAGELEVAFSPNGGPDPYEKLSIMQRVFSLADAPSLTSAVVPPPRPVG